MSVRQYFDDGTWLDFDESGNVLQVGGYYNASTYQSSPAYVDPRASVLDQFVQSALGGVTQAFNRAINPPVRPVSTASPRAAAANANMTGLLLLVGVVFLVKALSKG